MYINSGYLRNSRVDFKDHTRPLVVGSCGTYRLSGQPASLPTHRPRGRVDYQLLYVAAGKARFFFNFIRSLKQYTGMTPKQYITSLRIVNAQMLLESSSYTIQEIADFVGYGDALYFGRLFKREIGMTPSQYRRQYQNMG